MFFKHCAAFIYLLISMLIILPSYALEYVDSIKLINTNSNILESKRESQNFFTNIFYSKNELAKFNPMASASFNILEDIYVARFTLTENIYDAGLRKNQSLQALNTKELFEIVGLQVEQGLYIQSISIFLEVDKYKKMKILYTILNEKINHLLKYKSRARNASLISRDELLEVEVFADKIRFSLDSTHLHLDSLARKLRFLTKKKDLTYETIGSPDDYITSSYDKLKQSLFFEKFDEIKLRQLKLKELGVKKEGINLEYLIEKSKYMPKLNLSVGANAYKDRLKRKSDDVLYDFFILLTLDIPLLTDDEKKYLQKSYIYSTHSLKSLIKYEGNRIVQSIKDKIERIESNQSKLSFSTKSSSDVESLIEKIEKFIYNGQESSTDYIKLLEKKMINDEKLINAKISLLARKAELLSSPTLNLDGENANNGENSENEVNLNNGIIINEQDGNFYEKSIPIN